METVLFIILAIVSFFTFMPFYLASSLGALAAVMIAFIFL
jgi:hypothetical protein